MSSTNTKMDLWSRAFKTDPTRVKKITGKDYGGSSPSPYYIVQRLTEEFGQAGKGWGIRIISERMERMGADDILHIAHVMLWYVDAGERCEIEQLGQTKAAYRTKGESGYLKVDEDAPKKSVTDALVKCASYLGFAGDIFSGRWDDSKYVAELGKEFAADKARGKTDLPYRGPTHGPSDGISEKRLAELDDYALTMIEAHQNGNDLAAFELYYRLSDNEEKVHVWGLLKAESKLRAAIKANPPKVTA